MGASNEKGDAKGSVEEGGKMVRARWGGVTKWEGVGWITGRNESIQSVHDTLRVWHLDCSTSLAKARQKNEKKSSLLPLAFVTRHCSNPLPPPQLAQGGPAMSTGRKQNPVC